MIRSRDRHARKPCAVDRHRLSSYELTERSTRIADTGMNHRRQVECDPVADDLLTMLDHLTASVRVGLSMAWQIDNAGVCVLFRLGAHLRTAQIAGELLIPADGPVRLLIRTAFPPPSPYGPASHESEAASLTASAPREGGRLDDHDQVGAAACGAASHMVGLRPGAALSLGVRPEQLAVRPTNRVVVN